MADSKSNFVRMSEKVAFDEAHRKIINFNISKYHVAAAQGKERLVHLEMSR